MKNKIIPSLAITLIAFGLAGCMEMEAKVSETIEQTIPLAIDGSIELSSVNGSIEIASWDRNEVSIVAIKTANNQQHLDALQLEIEHEGETLRIAAKHNKTSGLFSRRSSGGINFKLNVPSRLSAIKVETVNSRINATSLAGNVTLSTVNGGIDAQEFAGSVKLSTVNGGIELSLAPATAARSIELSTVNGSCSIALPAGLSADVQANTVNGRINMNLPSSTSEATRRSLTARLGQGGLPISLSTVNGSVTIQ